MIQLFTPDQYIDGEYKFVETKVQNLNINGVDLDTSRFAYIFIGAAYFWIKYTPAVNISGTKSFFCYPVVEWIETGFSVKAPYQPEGNAGLYNVAVANTTSYNLSSVSADSIEIYLCK